MILWEPLIAVLIWGLSYSSIKIGVSDFPPFAFMALGLGIASIILYLIPVKKKSLKELFSQSSFLDILNAVLAQMAFQCVFVLSIKLGTASGSALLLATSPLITSLWLYFAEKQKTKWFSLALGFVGVYLILNIHNSQNSLMGNLFGLASAFTWSWYSLAIKKLIKQSDEYIATSFVMFIPALIFGLISVLIEGFAFWNTITLKAYTSLFYNAFISLPIGLLLWNRGLQKFGANRIMMYTYLEPVIASLVSVFFIKESLSLNQIIGGILTLIAISLS